MQYGMICARQGIRRPPAVTRCGSTARGGTALIQVSRSLEPEHEALSKLLVGLFVGGLLGLVGAALGGWFLAGKSLRPVKVAFDRQHAFVADASHELRTPLAVIRANAEFISTEQPENAEAKEIMGETDRLSGLVDALLAVARGDEATPALALVVDVAELTEGAVASFQPLAAEKGLELTVRPPSSWRCRATPISCDRCW